MVNYSNQDSPSVWDILGNFGKRVGAVNVPVTFPPNKVNGFMVSGGLLTPLYSDVGYTFPPQLKRELDKVTNGYEVLPFTDLTVQGREEEYLEKFIRNIEKQVKAVKYLMNKEAWDFLTYVFFVTDSVQHYCWHHMDETHPWHDPHKAQKYGDYIKRVYKKVDASIGELIAEVPEDTNILVISDHGSRAAHGSFLINEWLKEKGLLVLKQGGDSKSFTDKSIASLKDFFSKHLSPNFIESVIKVLPKAFLKKFLVREGVKLEGMKLMESINWSKTKAYSIGSNGGIFINLEGREPEGIVEPSDYEKVREEIAEMLYEIENPSGGKAISKVFRKEEIYHGKHLDAAPDLMLSGGKYSYPSKTTIGLDKIWDNAPTSGGHSHYGTFIAYGPDIGNKGKEIQGAKIYDITPTVLHMFGIPMPEDLDGRVLREIFSENSELAKKSPVYQKVDQRKEVRNKIKELKRQRKL